MMLLPEVLNIIWSQQWTTTTKIQTLGAKHVFDMKVYLLMYLADRLGMGCSKGRASHSAKGCRESCCVLEQSKTTQLLLGGKRATAGLSQHWRWLSEWDHKKCCILFPVTVKPCSGEKNKSYYQISKNNWENGCFDFQVLLFLYFPLLKNPK